MAMIPKKPHLTITPPPYVVDMNGDKIYIDQSDLDAGSALVGSPFFIDAPSPFIGDSSIMSSSGPHKGKALTMSDFFKLSKEFGGLSSHFSAPQKASMKPGFSHIDPNSIHTPTYVKSFEILYSPQNMTNTVLVEFLSGAAVEANMPPDGFHLFEQWAVKNLTPIGIELIDFVTRYGKLIKPPEGAKTATHKSLDYQGVVPNYVIDSELTISSPPIILLGGPRSGEFVSDSGHTYATLSSAEEGSFTKPSSFSSIGSSGGITTMTLDHYTKEKLYQDRHGKVSVSYVYFHPSVPPEARYSFFCSAMEEFPELRVSFPYYLFWDWS